MLLTYIAVQNDEKISHKNTSFDVEGTPGVCTKNADAF